MSKQTKGFPMEQVRRLLSRNRVFAASANAGGAGWQDFQFIWVATGLLLLLVAFEAWLSFLSPVRLLLGLLYILYMPGYCLAFAFFPRMDELTSVQRSGLSIGLSIALVPLLALLVNQLPTGLSLWPILLVECGFMALCTVIALERRLNLEPKNRPNLSLQPRSWWTTLPAIEKRLYKTVIGLLFVTAIYGAWLFLVPSADEFTTEFYILGPDGLAQTYPRQATSNESLTITMGIANREQAAHEYRVEVWAVNPWQDNQREQLSEVEINTLASAQTEEMPVRWSMPWAGKDQKVEFLLFIDDQPEAYRQLRLWLDVIE